MADSSQAIADILQQILTEYGSRISMDGASKILVSDLALANAIHAETSSVRTPYGPHITIATRPSNQSPSSSEIPSMTALKPVTDLEFEHYTHAFFGLASEDPKFILEGLKAMIQAMRPKGLAVVISVKVETGAEAEGGGKVVGLEDKLKYQSKGKIQKLSEVLEYAGFERGKIRSFEKSSDAGGKKVDAEVVLAMKWDQLTG